MEFASRIRWVALIAAFCIFLILVGWGLFSIARSIFDTTGGSNTAETTESVVVETAASARFIVQGPVVAREDHRSYEITVSPSVVTMTVFSDYGGAVIGQESYQNSQDAFDEFIASLAKLDLTDRRSGTTEDDDEAEIGACATGRTMIVEVDTLRRWRTTCDDGGGTSAISLSPVSRFFRAQVPDYTDLVSGTGL